MKEVIAVNLRAITAAEIMQKDVVTLDSQLPISEAVKVFEDYHITGAPVVDGTGRALGVLSLMDIARDDHVQHGRIQNERHEYYMSNPLEEELDDALFGDEEIFAKEGFSSSVVGEQRVEDWMTPKVISVDPSTDLQKVCELMATENIHRVLVTEESSVLGILSTFDIVRFLADNA